MLAEFQSDSVLCDGFREHTLQLNKAASPQWKLLSSKVSQIFTLFTAQDTGFLSFNFVIDYSDFSAQDSFGWKNYFHNSCGMLMLSIS